MRTDWAFAFAVWDQDMNLIIGSKKCEATPVVAHNLKIRPLMASDGHESIKNSPMNKLINRLLIAHG